jgi:hypothetical protein
VSQDYKDEEHKTPVLLTVLMKNLIDRDNTDHIDQTRSSPILTPMDRWTVLLRSSPCVTVMLE